MRIHSGHPEVSPLIKRWNSIKGANSKWKRRKSNELHRELMLNIVEPPLMRFEGELVLLYHRFLTMVPSGEHSFAHGSTMVSKDVYWVTVGRIDGSKLERTRAQVCKRQIGTSEVQFYTSPKFLVPLRSARVSLKPLYAMGKHEPHFVIRESEPSSTGPMHPFMLDLSDLGDHLFAFRRGEHDWFTKIEIVLGTKSVHAWLAEHGSEETYQALRKRL